MAIDVRAKVFADIAPLIKGELSDSHLKDNGLIMTTGTLEFRGVIRLLRGNSVELAYMQAGSTKITRFPRPLRIIKCQADPYRDITVMEVGCKLAYLQGTRSRDQFRASENPPSWYAGLGDNKKYAVPTISAQGLLAYCLSKINIQLAPGSQPLSFHFLRADEIIDDYVATIGDLLKSECLYGYLNMQEQLVIKRLDLFAATPAKVLMEDDLIDIKPIATSEEPYDVVTVNYSAVR